MVRKEDRGHGKFEVLTSALKLATYTINITSNRKVFPAEYSSEIDKLVYMARDIYHRLRVANGIRVKTREELLARRKLQNDAIMQCEYLLSEIQIAKLLFHLRAKRVKHWGGMVEELKVQIRAWRDSDTSRYRNCK